ncbi:collagenase [Undibacterium sp. TJN19]|uniref:M9 family metallopeptidase n=1 Tax=Undibacterium sp. TJN19 TaxID=3413055 RepID=UPI003BF05639
MHYSKKTVLATLLLGISLHPLAYAGEDHPQQTAADNKLKQAPKPHLPQALPPSADQLKYNLPPTKAPRTDLGINPKKTSTNTLNNVKMQPVPPAGCTDMNVLGSYSGSALADYIVNLPSYECHYGLFSLTATQAANIYSTSNFTAIVNRFVQEAARYDGTNMALVNLVIYLRAGYYLAGGGTMPTPAASFLTTMRTPIKQLIDGTQLYKNNTVASSTASETLKLVTNLHDEAYYLPSVRTLVQRYTNTPGTPNAADGLKNPSIEYAFTSALSIMFYAHSRPDGIPLLQADPSYANALNNFVVNNKAALLNTALAYQLSDTENEAFRFMQYAALKANVKPMVKYQLANSSITGVDSSLWLNAASAVKYYDSSNCSEYGTCNFENKVADAVLKYSYTCSPTIKMRAQDMTVAQFQDSCAMLSTEESYFHTMMQTKRQPVAGDNNTSLEVVVFDDYANYSKYASVIYDMSTDNGGMYLEGDPSVVGNQARFVAHEASWLRPTFQVWNLQHEYIHYLDGRFDMKGDFTAGTAKPTVWWIEGIAEYMSRKNDNQESIDIAKTGTYTLSQIFGNTYSMQDYVTRAYRWGYMATRFMMEKHRSDVDAVIARFRVGDYDGYQTYMNYIGSRYDAEFVTWVNAATTAGEPPLPVDPALPECTSQYMGKNCSKRNFASDTQTYAFIMLPAGAKNLKLSTSGGTGDVDLYVALDHYPSTTAYDQASVKVGNQESVSIATPTANRWYYVMLKAKQGFTGVTLTSTYD